MTTDPKINVLINNARQFLMKQKWDRIIALCEELEVALMEVYSTQWLKSIRRLREWAEFKAKETPPNQ